MGLLESRYATYANTKLCGSSTSVQSFFNLKYQNSKKIESARKELKNCEFSIDAIANPKPFDFKNKGDGINSEWEEYLPSVSADGKLFVITRRGPHQNNVVSEDFYQSEFLDGK